MSYYYNRLRLWSALVISGKVPMHHVILLSSSVRCPISRTCHSTGSITMTSIQHHRRWHHQQRYGFGHIFKDYVCYTQARIQDFLGEGAQLFIFVCSRKFENRAGRKFAQWGGGGGGVVSTIFFFNLHPPSPSAPGGEAQPPPKR